MNTDRLAKLEQTYLETLKARIAANPENYPWVHGTVIYGNTGQTVLPGKTPETFTAQMIQEAKHGNVSTDKAGSPTMYATLKTLGVKPTCKALLEWLNS